MWVVGVTDGVWLSLGYEHYDAHLRCLGASPADALASADSESADLSEPPRLGCFTLSRSVTLTDPDAAPDRR